MATNRCRKKRTFLVHFSFPLLLLIFFNLFWLPSTQAATDCATVTEIPQTECETLLSFYNSTDGPNWSDSPGNNWNVTNTPCSDWEGITCDGGYVTEIYKFCKLMGLIPDLSALTQLQTIDLLGA